jgi:methylenetetrahydrofolate dehydrogenase (NADP+)/methenyltetrahydrofolate cyclohydrolase
MTKLLAAKPLVEKLKSELVQRCEALKRRGIQPKMSVVLVGDNPASLSYIRNKKRMCEEVGASFELLQLPSDISEQAFLGHLKRLNQAPSVHGIIIQLPVSDHLKKLNLPNLVNPEKDIDGFHGLNTQRLYAGTRDLDLLLPCTPKGIINLLHFYGVELTGKNIVVIGRSLIVGKPLSMLLTNFDATVTLAHSKTKDLEKITRNADIIVIAIGQAHLLSKKHINPELKTIVIDVGMNTIDGKLTGDVDQEQVRELVGGITPVPGGVGPMTVISLIQNLVTATEHQTRG